MMMYDIIAIVLVLSGIPILLLSIPLGSENQERPPEGTSGGVASLKPVILEELLSRGDELMHEQKIRKKKSSGNPDKL
jgi:hypothetical protein